MTKTIASDVIHVYTKHDTNYVLGKAAVALTLEP